ncbi:crystallin J1A-like [Mercenaria mercenaria]|uniref:crystallin J1A-like n=1 Tax=Mercenaria mercenaria TaxID=6596 RepID=UPI001E1D6FA9|nr:crystallin J1A-like [Mercenaria mercenaria]
MSSALQSRRIAAVVGALVADAAAQPIHWNYKVDKLDAMLKNAEEVAFWEPSANPFYKLPLGNQSCYGDQSFVVLKSLVENKGLCVEHLKNSTFEWFGPKSKYENPTNAVYKIKTDAEKATTYPIDGPWRHFSIKDFIRNVLEEKPTTGSEKDEQMDCTLRIVSVVALYAGRPEMLDRAEEVIRSTQNSDTSVAVGLAAARLLEYYILNGVMENAVEHVIEDLTNQNRANAQDLDKALASFLREVLRKKDEPHIKTARTFRID